MSTKHPSKITLDMVLDVTYKQMDRYKLALILRYIDKTLLSTEAAMVSKAVIRGTTDLQSNRECEQLRWELLGRNE